MVKTFERADFLNGSHKKSTAAASPSTTSRWLTTGQIENFSLRMVDEMIHDHAIRFGLLIVESPVHTAKFKISASSSEVRDFVADQLKAFWKNGITMALRVLRYGYQPGTWRYKPDERGRIAYDRLECLNAEQCLPLEKKGTFCGLTINKEERIFPPKAAWFVNEPEEHRYFGRSILKSTYTPYLEKCGRFGAIDSRAKWATKFAFTGGSLYYPETITDTDGITIDGAAHAQELMAKMENGGTLLFPRALGQDGKPTWEYVPPHVNGGYNELGQYVKDLDVEIYFSMGIPPEVINASETGSGWSGRAVPFSVFLTREDSIVDNLTDAFDRQCLAHMVRHNYGRADYKIEPVSLLEMAGQQQGGEQQGQPMGQPMPQEQDGGGGQSLEEWSQMFGG